MHCPSLSIAVWKTIQNPIRSRCIPKVYINFLVFSFHEAFSILVAHTCFQLTFLRTLAHAMTGPRKTTVLLTKTKAITTSIRFSSSSLPRQASLAASHVSSTNTVPQLDSAVVSTPPRTMPKSPPLSILPLSSILRSLATTSISSSRVSLVACPFGSLLTSSDAPRAFSRHYGYPCTLQITHTISRLKSNTSVLPQEHLLSPILCWRERDRSQEDCRWIEEHGF